MIWVACLLRSLNLLVCLNIKIVRLFRRISTFVNQLLWSSLISLSKICSRCSMRKSKKKACFKVKKTFLFENSSQNNCELQSTSSLQSIRSRRLVKTQKAQNRKVEINTCLRNQFALFSTKICLRNRSIYHIKCSLSSTSIRNLQSKLLFSFSYFFVFFRFFFLLSHSFSSFQLQEWIALTSTNKSFRSLIVSFNKSNEFVASKRIWEKTRNKSLE